MIELKSYLNLNLYKLKHFQTGFLKRSTNYPYALKAERMLFRILLIP